MSLHRRAVLRAFAALMLWPGSRAIAAEGPLVFAAASMKEVLEAAAARFRELGGPPVRFSFAGSGALARQIGAGAPADLFVSADPAWVDWLVEGGLAVAEARATIAANSLVLVGPAGSGPVELEASALLGRIGDGRLALGDTRAVPAGVYARQALEAFGIWDAVVGRLVEVENVRFALALVVRGEAPLAAVYATDAMVEPGVGIVAAIPDDSHAPILYQAALAPKADPGAAAFLEFLTGPEGRAVFRNAGFREPPSGG